MLSGRRPEHPCARCGGCLLSCLGDSALGLWEFSLLRLQPPLGTVSFPVWKVQEEKGREWEGGTWGRRGSGEPRVAAPLLSTLLDSGNGHERDSRPSLPKLKGHRFPHLKGRLLLPVSGPLHAGNAAGPEEQRRAQDPRLWPRARGEAAEAAERPGERPPPSWGARLPPWGPPPPPPWGARPSSLGSAPPFLGVLPRGPSPLWGALPVPELPGLHYPVRLLQQTGATGQVPMQSQGSPGAGKLQVSSCSLVRPPPPRHEPWAPPCWALSHAETHRRVLWPRPHPDQRGQPGGEGSSVGTPWASRRGPLGQLPEPQAQSGPATAPHRLQVRWWRPRQPLPVRPALSQQEGHWGEGPVGPLSSHSVWGWAQGAHTRPGHLWRWRTSPGLSVLVVGDSALWSRTRSALAGVGACGTAPACWAANACAGCSLTGARRRHGGGSWAPSVLGQRPERRACRALVDRGVRLERRSDGGRWSAEGSAESARGDGAWVTESAHSCPWGYLILQKLLWFCDLI